jgi:hypothetical protein
MAYFDRALELIAQLPESDQRRRQELDLRMKLACELNVSTAIFSFAQQKSSLARALELCNRIGDRLTLGYVQSYQARSLLASVYDGFTEGFDTQDLRDAKTLLDSL